MPTHALGSVPHSQSLLNVTACIQMQIGTWDCVCNQPCTLIHTSNDEGVPIQPVSDIQPLLDSQTQSMTQDDAHNTIYGPTNILEDGATSIHIPDDMPTASHVEVLPGQGDSNPIQFCVNPRKM